MSIEINGLEVVLNDLENLFNLSRVEKGITTATLRVERSAKQKAPKGELQQSITSKVEDFVGTVYTPLHYAPYVEYGTGIYATGKGGGRKEVPWVYVEGNVNPSKVKTIHTEQSAREAVFFLREQGLDAHMTYGQEPQPYMRPALDENREEIVRILGEALLGD